VHETLDRLVERGMAVRHARRPGQKEDRYEQSLGGGSSEGGDPPGPAAVPPGAEPARLDRLEQELAELREEVKNLREELGG
jgi:uncharacterized protein YceH (UPF0502 family)